MKEHIFDSGNVPFPAFFDIHMQITRQDLLLRSYFLHKLWFFHALLWAWGFACS
jgi:hypothetical protein